MGTEAENINTQNKLSSTGERIAEKAIDRMLNGVLDFLKEKYGYAQVLTKAVYREYLTNAYTRLNQVKTLITGNDPVPIIGKGNIYVNVGVQCQGKEISTTTVDNLLGIHNHILITGTGGIGKSMLMRYFFLNTVNRGTYIPVFIELRKLSNQLSNKEPLSIIDLILQCMNDYNVDLNRDQFIYSLEHGDYLFLMDGFDEIKEDISKEAAMSIQAFCSKYPKNSCIMTSRNDREFFSLETFVHADALMLTKTQAVELAHKIWPLDEKAMEFCQQLESTLYDRHKDFAENPLLLTMMFITFMHNSSIPDHLADFYKKSFEALYSTHDSRNKGAYVREFKTNDLEEQEFIDIFSHFCFITFFEEKYEFSFSEITKKIESSLARYNISKATAKDFLDDLQKAVCLIIKDGDIFKFSHRSFQAYFAALYTRNLNDDKQKILFEKYLLDQFVFLDNEDYVVIVFQLEKERFLSNALEVKAREIAFELDKETAPMTALLTRMYSGFECRMFGDKHGVGFLVSKDISYYAVFYLFNQFVKDVSVTRERLDRNSECKRQLNDLLQKKHISKRIVQFDNLNEFFTPEETDSLLNLLTTITNLDTNYDALVCWLRSIDNKATDDEHKMEENFLALF